MQTKTVSYFKHKHEVESDVRTLDIVIHHNDADGYCAAGLVALYRKLSYVNNGYVIYVETTYGEEDKILSAIDVSINDLIVEGKEFDRVGKMYILDFSLPTEDLNQLIETFNCMDVVYLDHHLTSKHLLEEFKQNDTVSSVVEHSSTKSGCLLTYEYFMNYFNNYFNSHVITNQDLVITGVFRDAYKVVELCNDYDLWIHANSDSLPFVTGISNFKLDVTDWGEVLHHIIIKQYIDMGNALIKEQTNYAERFIKYFNKEKIISVEGNRIAVINIPSSWSNIISTEITKAGIADAVISYYIIGNDYFVKISIRSADKDNCVNCAEIAKKYFNGGGHIHAAGGTASTFNEFIEKLMLIQNDLW